MDVAKNVRFALPLAMLSVAVSGLTACAGNTSSSPVASVEKPTAQCESTALPNRFIVKWKNGATTIEEADDAEALVRDVIEPNQDDIKFAEHDQVVSIHDVVVGGMATSGTSEIAATPSDGVWGLEKSYAFDAQTIADGRGITVAVIDSGLDSTHSQLADQILVNAGEIPGNGIDDDRNGYVDDVQGYDFHKKSPVIVDGRTGHGTHVAGIVLAKPLPKGSDGKEVGSKGVAPGSKLIPLRFMDESGNGYLSNAIAAIDYAVNRGARVINASWGGDYCSRALRERVARLESEGVLFVAASGNGDPNTGIGYNLDEHPSYPAAFSVPGLLTVGAITSTNSMAGFSNYSRRYVHLVAPGVAIWSTYPGNTHEYMTGTSMAAPFVTGAAALVWSYRPKATPAQIREALLASVDKGRYAVSSEGRLNVRRALDEIARLVSP